jgi:hypothetical protein
MYDFLRGQNSIKRLFCKLEMAKGSEGPFGWVGVFFFDCLSPWAASALFSGTTLIYRPCPLLLQVKEKRKLCWAWWH